MKVQPCKLEKGAKTDRGRSKTRAEFVKNLNTKKKKQIKEIHPKVTTKTSQIRKKLNVTKDQLKTYSGKRLKAKSGKKLAIS